MRRILVAVALLALVGFGSTSAASPPRGVDPAIHRIRHVVVIMQENRSFDSYFGTFPGADGIPMRNGVPTVCVPDPTRGGCVRPYVDHADVNGGGPHGSGAASADSNGGRMDGFVAAARSAKKYCRSQDNPACAQKRSPDVMGYHVATDIPNYWTYARDFVLQDHMFEPTSSWSLPAHLFTVSEWSAQCASARPSSCVNNDEHPGPSPWGAHGA